MLCTYLYCSSISGLYLFVQMSFLREMEYLPLEVKAHLLTFSFLHPPQGLAQPMVDTSEKTAVRGMDGERKDHLG